MSIVPPPSRELIEAVRNWVHYDNMAEKLNKQIAEVRIARNENEIKVLNLLENSGLKNAVLNVNGATLQRQQRFVKSDLSWNYLETQLHKYYGQTPQRIDETVKIINFLQQQRTTRPQDFLKKSLPSQLNSAESIRK